MKKIPLFILSVLLAFGALGFSNLSPRISQPESTYNIPDTPEAKEIMRTIGNAYDIEAEAAYSFELKKFPTVFINDPRFSVSLGTLETIRELTNNPSLKSAGWLDYKIAYYSWMKDAILHSEAVHAKANAENRELTGNEKKLLIDSKGRVAPARAESSTRKTPVSFLSVEIHEDIAIAIINDGPRTIQLTLVLVDKQWYIAAYKGIAFHP